MATVTSKVSGNWSDGSTWDSDPAIPVNNDDVVIDAAHTVSNFNVDMSGWANGIGLTVNGEFQCATGAGTYYLKNKADIDGSGTFRAGTSGTALPFAAKFTVDFNAGAFHFDGSGGLTVLLYCTEPTNTYVKLTAQEAAATPAVLNVDTDVTADIWADGDDVAICDMNKGLDTEVTTISAGGIAAGAITVTTLAAQKEIGTYVVLMNRNIKVTNVPASGYLYTSLDSTCYIRCENDCLTDGRVSGLCIGTEFAGVDWDSSGNNTYFHVATDNCVISGIMCGSGTSTGLLQCDGCILSGLAVGLSTVFSSCYNPTISGEIRGCNYGLSGCYSPSTTSTAILDNNYRTIYQCTGGFYYGAFSNNFRSFELDSSGVFSCSMTGDTTDLEWCFSGKAYNTLFGGTTEFAGYNASQRGKTDYFESFDHDQVANAFKAWCRGGIVVSSTSAPLPTGHTIRYDFTAEDTTQVYPVYRQFETTVQPGTAIEVEGYLAIPNGEDLTGYAPALQIINKFADTLVDPTQEPLDECEIPDPDGSETGYQAVSVIWANQGDAPRTVIVRMIVWHDGGGDDVVVYGAWSIADYKDKINDILADTNEIQGKLPDDYIMGSSTTESMDDEINAIKANLGQVHQVEDETPGGGGRPIRTSGIADGC